MGSGPPADGGTAGTWTSELIEERCATVHRAQGKEADVVVLASELTEFHHRRDRDTWPSDGA
ncbi:hypothetical protein [Streptomyces goshikiensis]|uniref:hypothetical protein n=1 Tax=Streptomyces goshikiensis TaxID=1942 RepID=UPI0036CB403B